MAESIKQILSRLRDYLPRDECWTCECLQGYLTQLEIDATDPASRKAIEDVRIPNSRLHSCLGCDPCPPADQFALYLQRLPVQEAEHED